MPHVTFRTTFDDEAQTTHFAQRLAQTLRAGDVILLSGDIGAGKTYFARQILLALLDSPEDIPSPTFTLVQSYDTCLGEALHADLYRLTSPAEADELGLFEAFGQSLCLIEWPDRLGAERPDFALDISLQATDKPVERVMHLSGDDALWSKRLREVMDE
jgi:tRNA threonylcarbamoyladenosine biosynthesis protein TsaE